MISRLFDDLRLGVSFLKSQGINASAAAFLSRDAHPLLQFVKYGACGAISVIVHSLTLVLLAKLYPDMWSEPNPDIRANNVIIFNAICFFPANIAAYLLNRWFVFTPGRHHWIREFSIFTAVSAFAFGIGLFVPKILIAHYNTPSWAASASFMVTSALINFAARKLLVFEK